MTIVQINHDAFARSALVRHVDTNCYRSTCSWCGQHKRTMFCYGTERDDRPGRYNWHSGIFCNKECHDDYHT